MQAGPIPLDSSAAPIAVPQALLDVNAVAGFGKAGVLTGFVDLENNALLEFASGQIASIAANSTLILDGANAHVADAGSLTGNSALTGLSSNARHAHPFRWRFGRHVWEFHQCRHDRRIGGVLIAGPVPPAGAASGAVILSNGGSLAVGGTLTNSGTISIDTPYGGGISSKVTAAGLTNTGTIDLIGYGAVPLTGSPAVTTAAILADGLSVSGPADNAGSIGIGTGTTLSVTAGKDYSQTAGTTDVSAR